MIDQTILHLLEQAIDTPTKLQLLLLFHESPQLDATPSQVAARTYRDIWSTREALRELAEDGMLLASSGRDEPSYRYRPAGDSLDAIRELVHSYNEPMERDALLRELRQIAHDAPYRRAVRGGLAYESVAI